MNDKQCPPIIYTDAVSDEPLEIIRANECESHVGSLGTKRFRALWNEIERLRAALATQPAQAQQSEPIPMVLYCPNCGMQHIDKAEMPDPYPAFGVDDEPWLNPPHRSHLCHGCGKIWRPADVATVGVASIKTMGRNDTWPVDADEIEAQPAKAQAQQVAGEVVAWTRTVRLYHEYENSAKEDTVGFLTTDFSEGQTRPNGDGWRPLTSAGTPHQQPAQVVPDAVIRDVFLSNGFTIKEGCSDLKPYVYSAARALLAMAAMSSLPTQAEQQDDRIQFRGLCDSSEMLRVRAILESKACYLGTKAIADIVAAAQTADSDVVCDALREMLEAFDAKYPADTAGVAAQDAWAERRDAAMKQATTVLAARQPQSAPCKPCDRCDTPGACRDYGGGYCPGQPQSGNEVG